MSYEHIPIEDTLYFIAHSPDGMKHIGSTAVGQVTVSGQANFIDTDDEQDLLRQAYQEGLDFTGYNPLPEPPISEDEADQVWVKPSTYNYGTELVVCRRGHFRGHQRPDETLTLFSTHRDALESLEWSEGETLRRGAIRVYQGVKYRCIQSHTARALRTPDTSPKLWRRRAKEWVVQEVVVVGDIRRFKRVRYRCKRDHTTRLTKKPPTSPALWEVV